MPSLSNVIIQSLEGVTGVPKDGVFFENNKVVTTSHTIANTKHAMSTGPVEIANNVTVTIADGSRWVIL